MGKKRGRGALSQEGVPPLARLLLQGKNRSHRNVPPSPPLFLHNSPWLLPSVPSGPTRDLVLEKHPSEDKGSPRKGGTKGFPNASVIPIPFGAVGSWGSASNGFPSASSPEPSSVYPSSRLTFSLSCHLAPPRAMSPSAPKTMSTHFRDEIKTVCRM